MGKSNNLKWLFFLLAALSLVLAACAGGSDSGSSKDTDQGNKEGNKQEDTNTGGTPIEGGDLVLAVLSDASSLDPVTTTDVPSTVVQANIFETLVKKDKESNIIPGLAESWDIVDETTYDFKLREGVKFHDGEDFNAEAVKVNLDRVRDTKVASPRYSYFEMINEVEVIDEYTVRLKLDYPFSPLLAHLSHNASAIVSPKSIAEDYAAMDSGKQAGTIVSAQPVGTGYFKFVSWTPGDEIKLAKNEDYWGDKVHVDTATFKVSAESGTRNADLERGFVQIADPVQPIEVSGINSSDFGTVNQQASASLSYIGFNTQKAPFDDVRVRKAISMMVNKDEIINGIYEGFGIPAKGPLSPGTFGYDENAQPIEYNPEEAKKLLEEAGLGNGFKTSIWTNDNPQRIDMAILLQASLKELNIDVSIEQMEFGAYLDRVSKGEHDMFILGWSNSTGDADLSMYPLFHSSQHGSPGNRTFYNNPEVDKLLDEGRRESNTEERVKIYQEIQKHLIEDAPMVYIHHQEYLTGVSNQITGFAMDAGGTYLLQDVQFVE